MSILERLQEAMQDIENGASHQGYWYCFSDVLTIMVCGMLCSLQTIDDIHEWTKLTPTKAFWNKGTSVQSTILQYSSSSGC